MRGAQQNQPLRRPNPQTQLLNNYRQYPDRYIRISGESWKLGETNDSALHSFTLKNIAGVAYSDIELRVNYLDANGKTLLSRTVKVPGILAAYSVKKVQNMEVKNVPGSSDSVLLSVAKAAIHP
jgi:hypothetical protein